jgi:hypothetical protein
MRAGAVRPPDQFEGAIIPEGSALQHAQAVAAEALPPMEPIEFDNTLQDLGFEEGEIEMFSEMAEDLVEEQELIERYLEIAQADPYNLNWTTVDAARNADYDTGVEKPNGTTYTKHDIANDTLNSFYDVISGHGGKRRRRHNKRKTRKNRKSRKSKKSSKAKKSRRYRRRH